MRCFPMSLNAGLSARIAPGTSCQIKSEKILSFEKTVFYKLRHSWNKLRIQPVEYRFDHITTNCRETSEHFQKGATIQPGKFQMVKCCAGGCAAPGRKYCGSCSRI